MSDLHMFPRSVYFKAEKAVGTFNTGHYDEMLVMFIPSDHYDFLGPISVIGKTKEEIEAEIRELMSAQECDAL